MFMPQRVNDCLGMEMGRNGNVKTIPDHLYTLLKHAGKRSTMVHLTPRDRASATHMPNTGGTAGKICTVLKYSLLLIIIEQESHAVAGKPRDAALNSDRYQQPVGQKQSE